jgi:uncharacterized protein (TIGR03000 family)
MTTFLCLVMLLADPPGATAPPVCPAGCVCGCATGVPCDCRVAVRGVSAAPATITVHCAPGAVLTFDGAPTTSTGSVRTFATPPLEAGRTYCYTLSTCDGNACTARRVPVTGGQAVTVTLAGYTAPALQNRVYAPMSYSGQVCGPLGCGPAMTGYGMGMGMQGGYMGMQAGGGGGNCANGNCGGAAAPRGLFRGRR